ncbi:conserved hypothetical protein [Leishmania major strain Friedlin]|uniref:Uncharacterized protein n=1 Tax=Leishmania major TaxID=5664 RepID=Q4Q2J1_LEIMA|nr:conserved hypothetical protein [Leishmania major strain Friedlin]CAG9582230.1 hypothetical_protein_-_conserved [Leishmania major strain Friedlin]CAJ08074.1 conserved hypothetical protein [Leishmania major strain Friedlin]|eukprot:XP_001686457.1 conserved hypothetical protein [Leishmania major strain Friedlin]
MLAMSHESQLLGLLWCEATQPSCNAATLTRNIGVAFRYLETPWDDKAKQIIGALITLNAGPMHTTIWAALFQQLRETDKPAIKVYILKQFANVCWTVPTNQAANAFRAFALEVRPLLEDLQVVVNATFQRSFVTTIKFFSSFAEKTLSNELFNAVYRSLKEWKRPDSIRAAVTVIAAMANDNPSCPSPEQLLRRARYDLDCFSVAVLLDTLVSFEVAPGRISDERRIVAFQDELSEIFDKILAAPQANEKVIPPCVSAYRRLKQVCDSWEPVAAEPFALFIVDALAQAKISKLLVCPFLHFLQETPCIWSRSSRIVWQLTGSRDPFVRADAYAALATTIHVIGAPEHRLVLADLMERLRFSIAEHCSRTTVAILKFVKKLLLHARFPPSAEELYLSKLLHLCRRHGRGLYHDVPAQLELLNVFLCARVAPDALVVFALELFSVSHDRAVAKKAFSVLRHFSTEVFLDSGVQTSGEYSDDANYFEAAMQMRCAEPFKDELLPFVRLHRTKGLSACIYARLCTLAENETKNSISCIIVCDAVKEICTTNAAHIFDDIFFKHTTLCLLSQLLVLQDRMPSDAYVSLLQACAACLQGNDLGIREDAHLLSMLVQHSWSAIVTCTTALFSTFRPAPVLPSCRFFRKDSLSQACRHLILMCRDIALSNDVAFYDSTLHEILTSNMSLFISCVSFLRCAPIFIAELVESVDCWLACCTILSTCVPKSVLRLLTVVLEAAETELPVAPQRAGATHYSLLSVARMCNSMVKQAIEMDLLLCCPEICNFLLFFISKDADDEVFLFRELIANNWTLVVDLFLFCERIVMCLHNDNDASALAAVLNLLLTLCDSVYFPQVTSVISRGSLEELLQVLRKTPDFSQKCQCVFLASHILAAFDEKNSLEEKMSGCFSACSTDVDFFGRIDRLVQLWNASDVQTQARLKTLLTSPSSIERLVCAAAVDVQYIPKAVEAALGASADREVLDVLLLIVTEAESETLSPLLFAISDAVFGENDDLVKRIIRSYRWGWYGGQETMRMLSSGAWRNLSTPLSEYLKLLFGFHQLDITERHVRCERYVGTLDSYESSLSFWQLLSGGASVDILQHEMETGFSLLRLTEVLQLKGTSALRTVCLLCDQGVSIVTAFGLSNIRRLAIFFSTGVGCELSSCDPLSLLRLLQVLVSTARGSLVESELSGWLQLSCWLLLDRVCLFSSTQETTEAASGKQPAQTFVAAELVTVFVQLSNLFLCSTAKTLDDVAVSVIRYAIRNATIFTMGDVSERLFWMVVRHCIYEVWAAITAETVASVRDPEIIVFLCRAHVKVGLPLPVQRELHALFTPQLLSYGNADSELEEDSLRYILWLVGKFASSDVHSSVRGGASSLQHAPKWTDTADIGAPSSGRQALKHLPAAESNFSRKDARSLAAAVRRVTAQLAERVLANTTGATPSNVLDALGVLCNLARPAPAESGPATPLLSNVVSLDHVYRIACDFTKAFPLLSADASLHPPGHCLDHLLGQLPKERRAHSIPDALCLNSIAWLLSKLLQSWGRENAPDSALPAQLPCVLALYLPYLLRCDLPSYLCSLQGLRYLSVCGATPEVEAVYDVALPRLMEDLVDVRWGAGLAGCWYEILVDCLSRVPGAVPDGGRQLSRRIWEGLWRGAGSVEHSCNQRFSERAQRSLQQVIHGLAPRSAQWELCRLVVLDSGLQSRRVVLTPVAASAFSIESHTEAFFWLTRELQERTWRSQLLQTQSAFVHYGAAVLDADSSRSLLFEFEKAVAPIRESPDERGEFAIGEEAACIIAEGVRDSLFSATDAALAALNHFDFADIMQRRAVLHELAKMMVRSDANTPSWAEVYFDVLYERTTWHDEGLWVACALATAAVGQTELCWSKTVLASLIPASSSAWKRELMRRIGQRAKISGAQREARRFFADAAERLSALQGPPSPWKRELLAAVLSVFSS